ncbi:MAG: hypothetical protein P8P22_06480 [Porticoccaceae bacterium]|nr:hypothetical protein [bacterium]MDG1307774.1 hypothetical protein [Porticoccaceae bacterium]
MKLLLSLICALMVPGLAWADSQEPKLISGEQQSIGLWKAEDCRKLSAGSGLLLAVSQGLLEESKVLNEDGKKREAGKKIQAALEFSQLATNLAANFRAYCKP